MTVRRTDRPTKVPGFPKVPAQTDPQMRQFLEAIVEAVDIRLGRKGDPTDRAITLRELIDTGLAKRLKASPYDPNNFGNSNIGFEGPTPIGSSPTAPTGVSVNGAYSQINIFFDVPYYRGHAQTEIWSHTSDVLGDATLAGVSIGRSFVDLVGSGATRYYWLRHVNSGGVHGPWNASAGTFGETAVDVAFMLDLLNGAITESELAISLSTPIAAIPGIQNTLGDINTDISGIDSDISGINSDISTLSNSVNTINTNLASTVTTSSLTTALGSYTTTTSLESNYYTKNDADSATQAAVLGLASTTEVNTALGAYTNTADLTNAYYTKTDADSAISAAINTYNTNTIGANYTNTADLTTNYYTKTGADSAISAAINTFNTNTLGANYTNTADLTTNYYTKTSADSATAAAINTYNTNTIGANYTNTADLTTNYYTKTGADSAISTAITTYNTNTIGANYTTTADLQTNYYTKTGADSAFASTSDILNAQVDDPDGGTSQVTLAQAMSTQADVNGDLKGQYTVKIDVNGAVAGFGLASTTTSLGTTESEFVVNADRFAIMRGGSDTSPAVTPFAVVPASTVNGVSIPAGVYMDAAFIRDATITAAQIGSINADTISTGTLSADYIDGGTIDASQVNIAGVGTGLNISSASSGSRMAMASDVIKIFDGNTLRVQLGNLSA